MAIGKSPRALNPATRAKARLVKAQLDIDGLVGRAFQRVLELQDRHDPCVVVGPEEKMKAEVQLARTSLREDIGELRRELRRVVRSTKRALMVLDLGLGERRSIVRMLDKKHAWGNKNIAAAMKSGLGTIRRAAFWSRWFARQESLHFPVLPELGTAVMSLVFNLEQNHNFGGVDVKVKKVKIDVTLFGVTINIAYLQFPQVGGVTPPDKPLVPARSVERRGITLHAVDTNGVQHGNEILPHAGGNPPLRFYGYGKILFGQNVRVGCRLKFQQVLRERGSVLFPDAQAWTVAAGGSGAPIADPPGLGEHPSENFGPNSDGMADFPNLDLTVLPFGTYVIRDSLFRTWVTLVCPAPVGDTTLGYWEWSFRSISHVLAPGVSPLGAPPGGGVPPPPGGWPDPGSGPTKWTDAADASPQATGDYGTVF